MKVVGTGLVLNVMASIGVFSFLLHRVGVQQSAWFFAICLCGWALLIVGFIMLVARKPQIGALLVGLGSLAFLGAVPLTLNALVFVPVGLVATVGAIRVARRKTARVA